jgi:hypothetical protein
LNNPDLLLSLRYQEKIHPDSAYYVLPEKEQIESLAKKIISAKKEVELLNT